MDFYHIGEKIYGKNGESGEESSTKKRTQILEIYPDFRPIRSKDLMVRGRSFYAIWDNERGMWSTDEEDIVRLIDKELEEYKQKRQETWPGTIEVKRMVSFSSNMWSRYKTFLREMYDTSHQLDENLTFANTEVKKNDYVSKRLSYPIQEGPIPAYDEIIGTLYTEEERQKLEWAIGAIIAGDAKHIQKFIVLYGEAGSGKSTFLNIVQKLFDGYYTTFEAKALTGNNNQFSTEQFKSNPLVAIQHDGDLSKIEDNTKLNSIISHEEMSMRELYKPSYTSRVNAFLFMGTNKPVKITDAKSGVIRRLIDVRPSGNKISTQRYYSLMSQIDFELGAIAYHCLQVYRAMGKNYYGTYRPFEMMYQTDVFFNFVEDSYLVFKNQDGISLTQAYEMYKAYCDDALVEFKLPKYKFREELRSYFSEFSDRIRLEGKQLRNYYSGFLCSKFNVEEEPPKEIPYSLSLDEDASILDEVLADCPAQYAGLSEMPKVKWINVLTKLSDLDTKKLHYVKMEEHHIVIDFDLKDDTGKKSMAKNLEAASKWPPTYAEFSKSGAGIHLHYIYDGDVNRLSRVYEENVEIKAFVGNSSLRRKLSKCNNLPVAHINSGLPLKGEKVINFENVKSEKGLRDLITRNLNKEIHPGTKPSIDFIYKILEEAYASGMKYDVTNMRPKILAFANNSTNQADHCIKLVGKMHFASEEIGLPTTEYSGNNFIFFDVEVYPNLFIIVWKIRGGTKVKMINPTPPEIEPILKMMLIGFNCRRYDNHILYARYLGYDNHQLFELSQRIINGSKNAMFGEAYNISYTDVYDFASAGNKQSLKKWEIELGIHHQEMGIPWDKDVPEDMWDLVADYCGNDVDATEAVFNHLSGDWAARQILAELSGLTVNDTTNQHSIKIIFNNNKNPQNQFVYTDLSEMFPGYIFDHGKSTYRGEEIGEGGKVYGEPGMYTNVALLDILSMHPTSTELLNLFGDIYTKVFSEVKNGRVYIKHEDYAKAKEILGGKLTPFIEAIEKGTATYTADDLATALKTVINSVYGLTSAGFANPFKDPRNVDNIVAKRGALFMTDLKYAVQEQGFTVAHIKTDSIKIPNATPEIIKFVMECGRQYGYEFEHEATYKKLCLVNNAVYIAQYDEHGIRTKKGKHANEWTATGTQFAQPYVFKTLFSHEPIEFKDLCETKTVTSALYLDMNEDLYSKEEIAIEKEMKKLYTKYNGFGEYEIYTYLNDENELDEFRTAEHRYKELQDIIVRHHDYRFIGKAGSFCPIKPGCGGGLLCREKDGKYDAATGAKDYRWLEAEMVQELGKEKDIDLSYYNKLVDDAISNISTYGDFEWFIADGEELPVEENPIGFNEVPPWVPPWVVPCGDIRYVNCYDCPNWSESSTKSNICKLGYSCLSSKN